MERPPNGPRCGEQQPEAPRRLLVSQLATLAPRSRAHRDQNNRIGEVVWICPAPKLGCEHAQVSDPARIYGPGRGSRANRRD